jgi:hypothetical protein
MEGFICYISLKRLHILQPTPQSCLLNRNFFYLPKETWNSRMSLWHQRFAFDISLKRQCRERDKAIEFQNRYEQTGWEDSPCCDPKYTRPKFMVVPLCRFSNFSARSLSLVLLIFVLLFSKRLPSWFHVCSRLKRKSTAFTIDHKTNLVTCLHLQRPTLF